MPVPFIMQQHPFQKLQQTYLSISLAVTESWPLLVAAREAGKKASYWFSSLSDGNGFWVADQSYLLHVLIQAPKRQGFVTQVTLTEARYEWRDG